MTKTGQERPRALAKNAKCKGFGPGKLTTVLVLSLKIKSRKRQSRVLGMGRRFRHSLKDLLTAQFDLQIRDSHGVRIQVITRSNSFPSITQLGRRFCQQIGCKSKHSHLHDELYYSLVILKDRYVCRVDGIKRRRQLMSKFCQSIVIFKYSKIPTWFRSLNYSGSNLRYSSK